MDIATKWTGSSSALSFLKWCLASRCTIWLILLGTHNTVAKKFNNMLTRKMHLTWYTVQIKRIHQKDWVYHIQRYSAAENSTCIYECESLFAAVASFINLVGVLISSSPILSRWCFMRWAASWRRQKHYWCRQWHFRRWRRRRFGWKKPRRTAGGWSWWSAGNDRKTAKFFMNQPETDLNRFVELDRMASEMNRNRFSNL